MQSLRAIGWEGIGFGSLPNFLPQSAREIKGLNFQITTKFEEPKKSLKVGYWGTKLRVFGDYVAFLGFGDEGEAWSETATSRS